jgi:pimeloyl-ACP methyl ester carboxylesterase
MFFNRFLGLTVLASLSATPVAHAMFSLHYARVLENRKLDAADKSRPKLAASMIVQKTNPQDPSDPRTFNQRYWVNQGSVTAKDAPVLLYLCGESTCSDRDITMGTVSDHRETLGATAISLEHRYYGESQPFPTMTTENLKYLTTENALLDIKNFIETYSRENGLTGKWIVIGGSYAGSLSAYFRLKYPELVSGSLASSAPVLSKADFQEYDGSITSAVGPVCADAMRKAVADIEARIQTPEGLAKMKDLFQAKEIRETLDFLYIVADAAAFAVQYGQKESFCRKMTSGAPTAETYAAAGLGVLNRYGVGIQELAFQSAESLDPKDYLKTFGFRGWMYQSCTEYGYFQNANQDPAKSVRSPLISAAYHDAVCDRLFGPGLRAQVDRMNQTFYEPLLSPDTSTNIFFTNGSNDPWKALSITSEIGNDVNPKHEYFMLSNEAHCDDLGSNASAAVKDSQKLFVRFATDWIKP